MARLTVLLGVPFEFGGFDFDVQPARETKAATHTKIGKNLLRITLEKSKNEILLPIQRNYNEPGRVKREIKACTGSSRRLFFLLPLERFFQGARELQAERL